MTTPPLHDPARTPSLAAAQRAERRARYGRMTPEEIVEEMPPEVLERNARRGAPLAIAERERRAAEAAEDAAEPRWVQARRDEIARINNANEYDIGSIGNYDPDEG